MPKAKKFDEGRRKSSIRELVKESTKLAGFIPREMDGCGTSSQSMSARERKDSVLASLVHEYPQLSASLISHILDECDGNIALCRQRISELASTEASNPVFRSIYGGALPTSPALPNSVFYPQWGNSDHGGQHHQTDSDSDTTATADGRRRPGPVQLPRTTQDSGAHTMTPPLQPSALLSPPVTASSGSRSNSPLSGGRQRNPFTFFQRRPRNNVAPDPAASPVAPPRARRLPKGQYVMVTPDGRSMSPPASGGQMERGRCATMPGRNGQRPAAVPPIVFSPGPSYDPLSVQIPLSNEFGYPDGGVRTTSAPGCSYQAQLNQAHLTQQRQRRDKMAGAIDAHKISIQEVARDLHLLSKYYNTEYKQPLNIHTNAIGDLQNEINELAQQYQALVTINTSARQRHGSGRQSGESSTPASVPADAKKADDVAAGWDCLQCTFRNHAALDRCEICDLPRIGPPMDPLPFSPRHQLIPTAVSDSAVAACYCCGGQGGHHPDNGQTSAHEPMQHPSLPACQQLSAPSLLQLPSVQPTVQRQTSDDSWTMVDQVLPST